MKVTPINNRVASQNKVKTISYKGLNSIKPQAVINKTSPLKNIFTKIKNLFSSKQKIEQLVEPKIEVPPIINSNKTAKINESVQIESKIEIPKPVNSGETVKMQNIEKVEKQKNYNEELFEMKNIIDKNNTALLEDFFTFHPDINLNTKFESGDTLLLKAARREDLKFIQKLDRIEDSHKFGKVDWNAIDSDGNNAAMIVLNSYHEPDIHGSEIQFHKDCEVRSLLYFLTTRVNFDYINPKTKRTFLQEAIVQKKSNFIDMYLYNFRDKDINVSHPDTPPASFLAFLYNIDNHTRMNILERSDLTQTYKGKSFFDYTNYKNIPKLSHDILDYLEKHLAGQKLEEIKKYYEEEGSINLEQLINYAKMPAFWTICNKPLNKIGENIGHFVTELFPKNFEEVKQISDLIDLLFTNGYKITECDALGRTAIDKAIEGNNTFVLKFLLNKIPQRNYGSLKNEFYDNIEKLIKKHNITDEKVLRIFQEKNTPYRSYW